MAGLDDETQANQELADELNMDEADWERLRQDINSADSAEPRCGAPDVRELPATVSTLPGGNGETVAFWHEEGAVDEDGRPRVWRLTEGQRVAYERLKVAGSKQLLSAHLPLRRGRNGQVAAGVCTCIAQPCTRSLSTWLARVRRFASWSVTGGPKGSMSSYALRVQRQRAS